MALLQYGLPQRSFVCFRAEKKGWMAVLKIKSAKSVECKNQILPVIAYSAKPYHKIAMVIVLHQIKVYQGPDIQGLGVHVDII